jgi:hypothetical protein
MFGRKPKDIGSTIEKYRKHYIIHRRYADELSLVTVKTRRGFHTTFTGFRTQNSQNRFRPETKIGKNSQEIL